MHLPCNAHRPPLEPRRRDPGERQNARSALLRGVDGAGGEAGEHPQLSGLRDAAAADRCHARLARIAPALATNTGEGTSPPVSFATGATAMHGPLSVLV